MTLKANDIPFAGGKKYELLEPANYPARVAQVIDLGLQAQRPYEGKEKPPAYEIMVTYELGTEFLEGEDGKPDESKPRFISERFSIFPLQSEKAKSTKRYLTLDPNVEEGGDWSQLVGKPCLVAVVTNKSKANGKEYNNVGGVSAPIKGMAVPELVNEPKVFDLDDPDMEVFNDLPDWIQNVITDGLEFRGSKLESALIASNGHDVDDEDDYSDGYQKDDEEDEDVPF